MIVPPHAIFLDSRALSALSANQRSMQPWVVFARRTDSTLHASTVTLAAVSDGSGRDAAVRRVAKAVRLHPATADIGYAAGSLRSAAASSRRKPRDLTVDAVVAATALTVPGPVLVLTSDPADLALLLQNTAIRVEAI